MTRELTSHQVNGLNEALTIEVLDEPGAGAACHRYVIRPNVLTEAQPCFIHFQNGPLLESGVNGISNEALLAIVEDRLIGFQSGPYACRENAVALTKLQEAMMWLQKRTRDRLARGSGRDDAEMTEDKRTPWLRSAASDKDEMSLPAGKTCQSCVWLDSCRNLFNVNPANEVCDWSPSRYEEMK